MALQMTWQHRSRKGGPPLGLKNLGNTCYLNSVLQCLTYTPPLAQFCLSSQHSALCKAVAANRERECPFCILERQIARSLSLEGPLDTPSKIQKSITLYAEHFRWGRQEDAHEFLRYVIDACHNACLKLLSHLSKPKPNGAANGNAKGGAAEAGGRSTVMKDIFGGVLLSQVKCLGCKGESNKTDEIMDISLDLFQSNSLKDALARFFQPEVLDDNNKYSCGYCKSLCVARKQMFIKRAPNVLVVQLKRFEGIHGGKINRNIEFEEGLALKKYMCNGSQDPQPEYNLFGIIVHSGYSPESGHYYAYIKDAYDRWYCCNDTHVSLSSTQEVLSEKVYILFYIRSSQNSRSSKTDSPCKGLKSSDLNGIDVPPRQKSAELVKPPVVKPNGPISSRNNVSTTLKNGKISSNPQIKPIILKKVELKKVVANGNSNVEVHNSASIEKCNFARSPDEKKNKIVQVNNSMEEPKTTLKAEMLLSPKSNAANGSASSDVVEHNGKQTSSVANTHESVTLSEIRISENSRNCNMAALKREPDCSYTSNSMVNEGNSGNLGSKRKAAEAERTESLGMCCKESRSLSMKDVSCEVEIIYGKHSPEEFEKFKEALACEAASGLQSSGWVDRVQSFMRARKRLCKQEPGSYQKNSELKQQLINDVRKTSISQIPESLKGHLIERLRSFSQRKPLLEP